MTTTITRIASRTNILKLTNHLNSSSTRICSNSALGLSLNASLQSQVVLLPRRRLMTQRRLTRPPTTQMPTLKSDGSSWTIERISRYFTNSMRFVVKKKLLLQMPILVMFSSTIWTIHPKISPLLLLLRLRPNQITI